MTLQILGPNGIPFNEQIDAPEIDTGKTKAVLKAGNDVALIHKGILTAYDDPEFTGEAPNKGAASAYSSALLFKRLEAAGVRTSHKGIINANTTRETNLTMLPFEIISRSYDVPGNSLAKRQKRKSNGEKYDNNIYEVCLKWSIMTESGEIVHDPFLMLDEHFQPVLDQRGLPRLMHSKKSEELIYNTVFHPNKGGDMSLDEVRSAVDIFTERSSEIREMVGKVQEVAFDTYAGIGRINADFKIEVGLDNNSKLVLGDELELDAMRNMNPQTIVISGEEFKFEEDPLGTSLEEILGRAPQTITKIIQARHSGKQHYRDQVDGMKDQAYNERRKQYNNEAAQRTTQEIYTPTALALSERYGDEVGFILSAV